MAQLNLLHVCNSYSNTIGGAERIVRYLHTGLIKIGVNSNVVGLYHNNLETDKLENATTLGVNSPYKIASIWSLFWFLKSKVNPDTVIHGHLFPTIFYLALFKRLGLISNKIVVTEHSTSNNRRNKWYGAFLDRYIFNSYNAVYAISEGVAQSLVKREIVHEGKIRVVNNGIPLKHKSETHRLAQNHYKLISVGSLREPKNYSSIIRALAKLKLTNWSYVIAGEGNLESDLRDLIDELGLETKITLIGRSDDIDSLLLESDIFIMASSWEGFGLAAVEAMNASLPMVISDIPGLRELVIVEGSLLTSVRLVNPNSIQSIKEGVNSILSKYEKYIMGISELYNQSLRFSDSEMINKYLDQYKKLKKY